jgi:hypothetical protein
MEDSPQLAAGSFNCLRQTVKDEKQIALILKVFSGLFNQLLRQRLNHSSGG